MPFTPTYDGIPMMGPVAKVTPVPNPQGRMVTAYPGVNGLQVTNMGTRGGQVLVEGTLFGVDEADLAAAEALWIAYQASGVASVLTDTLGRAWPGAILDRYMPEPGLLPWDSAFGLGRKYRAVFLLTK